MAGAPDAAARSSVLVQRDQMLEMQASAKCSTDTGLAPLGPPTTPTTPTVEVTGCPICFNAYSEEHRRPRILVSSRHTFCSGCLNEMLSHLPLQSGSKRLMCPVCRKECKVHRGIAESLPINWLALGS